MATQFIYGGPETPVSFDLNYLQIQGNRPQFLLALASFTVGLQSVFGWMLTPG